MSVNEQALFLAGKWVAEGELAELRSPYDGSVIAQVRQAGKPHVEAAIRRAQEAFAVTRRMPGHEKQRIAAAISHGIAAKKDELARLMALEAGKPLKAARAEVDRAVFTFQLAAQESTRIAGELVPMDAQPLGEGRLGMVRRFALGPVLAITPFNFPLNLVAHKLAPALAAGCPVVLKPASQTPLTALALARIMDEAGLPKGALSVLPMSNELAAELVASDAFKMLTFTGSAKVGWELKSKSGKKRVVLELGGNAGVIIHADADVEKAAERCVAGGFSYAGQSCISVQRIYVHRNSFEKFLSALVAGVAKLVVGDPLNEKTDVGPLIRESDARRTEEWIAEAVNGGAKLLTGGKRLGSVVTPAVLTGTKPNQQVNCEEIFAPVVTCEPYDDFEAALASVNSTRYGLQAGVFTHDARLIFRAYEMLEVGGVMVNDVPTFRIDHMPYGGVKDSGLGREGVRYAIEEMTEPKLLVMTP